MQIVKFLVPATEAEDTARHQFYRAKQLHYEQLLSRGIPGAAWFRHQARSVQTAQHEPGPERERRPTGLSRGRTTELAQTYGLFTGGRAMSENLQLDRVLPEPSVSTAKATVEVDSIEGITVRPFDYGELIRDVEAELDPLAGKIPADQHVMFFPSVTDAIAVAGLVRQQGTVVLRLAEPRSVSARTIECYERQFCLSLDGLARLLGPQVARSVALTGSDPYFRTGTDVAVLIETPQPDLLQKLLVAQINLATAINREAKLVRGEVGSLSYHGVRSPDRRVSSYVAKLDGVIAVTNSLYQLGRLASVHEGESESIASIDEYVFFRSRYPVGDGEETAFGFLSDATIRRWCGPRWRIATSRHTRQRAVLAELQAKHLEGMVQDTLRPGPLHSDLPMADAGKLTMTRGGVHCSVYGTLEYMTPIAELSMDRVTPAEAEAYRRWRDGYQRNWTASFDPIALRLGLKQDGLLADATVMPLIVNTRYRQLISVSQEAKVRPDSGDPHGALAHFILAINKNSKPFRQGRNFFQQTVKGATLGWLGDSVALYADEDPFWEDMAKTPRDELPMFFLQQARRIPVAAHAEVTSGFRLTAFLAGLRAFIEQTVPGMTVWESLTYRDEPYVKLTPSDRARSEHGQVEGVALFYCPSGDSLVVTLSEDVLKRALDRRIARREAEKEGKQAPPVGKPWLGSSVGLQVDGKVLQILSALAREEYQALMQGRAWGNLPILNEWKRRFPNEEPGELHERLWQTRLLCPGGGKYVWNERWQTMESTVYGHPAEPKRGPDVPPTLLEFTGGEFGISFQHQGLRARVILERGTSSVGRGSPGPTETPDRSHASVQGGSPPGRGNRSDDGPERISTPDEIRQALRTLHTDPTDPEANLAAGKYFCFVKEQWERGMPMLALGSDAALKAVAEKELRGPTSPEEQFQLAQGWWELAQTCEGKDRNAMMLRAGSWYQDSQRSLAESAREEARKRLELIAKLRRPIPQAPIREPSMRSVAPRPLLPPASVAARPSAEGAPPPRLDESVPDEPAVEEPTKDQKPAKEEETPRKPAAAEAVQERARSEIRQEGGKLLAHGYKGSWSPDGTRVVYGSHASGIRLETGGGIAILDLETGKTTQLVPSGKDPVWSPGDGKLIAYVSGGYGTAEEVWVVEASGENPRKLARGGFPSWAPDGKTLYFHSRSRRKLMAVRADAEKPEATEIMDMPCWYPAISPDGKQVAFRSARRLVVSDLESGQTVRTYRLPAGGRGFLGNWSADGSEIGFGGFGAHDAIGLWILNLETGQAMRRLRGSFTMPAWSPDGSKIIFDHRPRGASEIWMIETKALDDIAEVAADDLPAPRLALVGTEESTVRGKKFTRYRLSVTNWSAYPDDLFQASPNLPAIGRNTRASRTVVHIYSADGRCLYGFVAFSSAANLRRLWFAVREGSTPPEKVFVVLEDRLRRKKYQSNVVSLRSDQQLQEPSAADRYVVPEGGVVELLKFIKDLKSFHPGTREEYANHRRKAAEALEAAAKRILELETDESFEAYQTALRVLLEARVRTIRDAGPEQQQETVAGVKRFLAAKAETGLHPHDASLAMSTARALEYADNRQSAVQAYRTFAELIAKSSDPKVSEMAKTMEGAARRLDLLGEEMEITGTTLDGIPFDWSAYRGKVVLVDFWATWCGPCRAELSHVRTNYQRYHDRGFEVVGISLDRSRDTLQRFLEKEQLPWVTLHESDTDKKHPMAVRYGVMSIPTVILVNREGRVVSLRARGAELDRLLEQLIGPPERVPFDESRWPETAGASLQQRELPEELLLYMPFEKNTFVAIEEKTYVRDFSGRKNHGCGRGATFTPDGRVGGALVVDDGGLRLPGNLLDKATDYTVTAWIKRTAREDRLILYQERFGAGTPLLEMDFFPLNGRPRAKVWNRRKTPDNWAHVDGDGMAAGQWHFVTFTVTGARTGEGTLKITVDGRAFRHDFQMLDVRDAGYGFLGGGKGMIDELAIFNRALSEEEIQALQQGRKGGGPRSDLLCF